MKILFLGAIGEGQTSLMRLRALRRLGHEVVGVDTNEPWASVSWAARQTQRRLCRGAVIDAINRAVLGAAATFRPQLVWAEKQDYLRPETVAALGAGGAQRLHFTPDPYFWLDWRRTALMDAAIGEFDVLVYCKTYERADYEAVGKPLIYMPLGYCDETHRPMPSDNAEFACAIGFLGGWEPRREHLLRALAEAGSDVKIRGGYWDFLQDGRWTPRRRIILGRLAGGARFRIAKDELMARAWRGGEVYADDYARAVTAARIGVGFLRQAWPDQHTTRTFEIPACGSLLLADRTEEHQGFFEEGREAEFFDSADELVDKATFYAGHETECARLAAAGRDRCIRSGYAYIRRLADVLAAISRGATSERPRVPSV